MKQYTASNAAYEKIRDAIFEEKYERGEKLTEVKLADELGVSRTPVRDAMRKLEEEGLIKDKRVINPTIKDLMNTFDVRMLLEGYAVRQAARYMGPDQIEDLQQCVEAAKRGKTEEIMDANKEFHDIIVKASNNDVLIDTIDRMQSVIFLFRRTVVYHQRPRLIEEHEAILEAIRNHEEEQAEWLMKSHLKKDLDFSIHSW
ncbi:GntR family transcriptional regulator [Marinococcus halophilus]|uniref:GntR family transcriptional regulator n=1 Tax=Marinococcus halophilus TaxID=1371 RepID=A0A510Y2K4_MARHA|nr:GntR family transcriptional regulator [Marinococcus halophilus]OZT81575.1 GntR family transcriptional regulator [Marinococcus halophilus]GEK57519.1 GntR family transcriptional regulator [Marinococcus halophilus]